MPIQAWKNTEGLIRIPHIEWHAAHACNFTCESCNHFSNHAHTEIISKKEIREWIQNWSGRLAPESMAVLGGEPLMNKEILDIISIGRDLWKTKKNEFYEIVTNGWLLHRWPDLPKVLLETDCVLSISIHGDSLQYNKKFQEVSNLVNEWINEYGIKVRPYHSSLHWYRQHLGYGDNMEPFEDNDAEESWHHCTTGKDCFQLLENDIYKCAPLAYLPLQKSKYPNMSSKWDPYLEYRPLTPDASTSDIIKFFNMGAEEFCKMCPANPMMFKKRDPELPIKFYESKK